MEEALQHQENKMVENKKYLEKQSSPGRKDSLKIVLALQIKIYGILMSLE